MPAKQEIVCKEEKIMSEIGESIIRGLQEAVDFAEGKADPIHPGEILSDELEEIDINALQLSKRIGVPHNRIYQIIGGKREITADTAIRLAAFFGSTPEFWLNLQKQYELDVAHKAIGDIAKKITPYKNEDAKQPELIL